MEWIRSELKRNGNDSKRFETIRNGIEKEKN